MSRFITAFALALALGGLQAAPAFAKVILVDDDHADYPTAPFTSIQAAVDVAVPGDIIEVARGTYNESVIVNKSLDIRGWQSGNDAQLINRVNNPAGTDESIVGDPARVYGFQLAANSIILDGFRVQGMLNGFGVTTDPRFSGYQVINNVIQENGIGMSLNSTTAAGALQTTVRRNLIYNNFGYREGIYSDQGLANAEVDDNTISANIDSSIDFRSGANPNFPTAFQRDIEITANTIDSGELFINNTSNTLISQNQIFNTGRDGIQLLGAQGTGNEISQNQISGCRRNGILLNNTGTTSISILDNDVFLNLRGIALVDAKNNVVLRNTSRNNGRSGFGIGIFVDSLSTGNLFDQNVELNNLTFDAEDDSVGSGTAGTGNTWTNNQCNTSSPAGICQIPGP